MEGTFRYLLPANKVVAARVVRLLRGVVVASAVWCGWVVWVGGCGQWVSLPPLPHPFQPVLAISTRPHSLPRLTSAAARRRRRSCGTGGGGGRGQRPGLAGQREQQQGKEEEEGRGGCGGAWHVCPPRLSSAHDWLFLE